MRKKTAYIPYDWRWRWQWSFWLCESGSFGFENTSSIDEVRGGLSNCPIIPELFLFSNGPIIPKITLE